MVKLTYNSYWRLKSTWRPAGTQILKCKLVVDYQYHLI